MKSKRKGAALLFLAVIFILALASLDYLLAQPWLDCSMLPDCRPYGSCGGAPTEVIGCRLRCANMMVVCGYIWR
jgi:hypothetical protein